MKVAKGRMRVRGSVATALPAQRSTHRLPPSSYRPEPSPQPCPFFPESEGRGRPGGEAETVGEH